MFHYDRGLKLTRADLAVDFRRRQPRGFISHGGIKITWPGTSWRRVLRIQLRLYHARMGKRPVLEMPYRQTLSWGGLRLTTYPAGHCLGSAMLLADDGVDRSLLDTGDFKLAESATAERAELPQADILVIESTYGTPENRHIPRDEAVGQLIELVAGCLPAA